MMKKLKIALWALVLGAAALIVGLNLADSPDTATQGVGYLLSVAGGTSLFVTIYSASLILGKIHADHEAEIINGRRASAQDDTLHK